MDKFLYELIFNVHHGETKLTVKQLLIDKEIPKTYQLECGQHINKNRLSKFEEYLTFKNDLGYSRIVYTDNSDSIQELSEKLSYHAEIYFRNSIDRANALLETINEPICKYIKHVYINNNINESDYQF